MLQLKTHRIILKNLTPTNNAVADQARHELGDIDIVDWWV
jgi:hypothetical protein